MFHDEVETDRCSCCRRLWRDVTSIGVAATRMRRDGTPCADCTPHLGHAMRSDPERVALWRQLLDARTAEHAAAVATLRARIAALESELRDRPEREVLRYVDADVLAHAKSEAERAFNSREKAWQALSEIRLLHYEVDGAMCRCGVRVDRCPVALIVDRYPA